MEECGICFKDLENNLSLSDDEFDNTEMIEKKQSSNTYNPIYIELLDCKTDKCQYKLCDDCKKLYFFKYKYKYCPNCREKIENIDQLIENVESQDISLNENFDDYYFPTHGLCRISIIYCKNCILFSAAFSFVGVSSFFLGALIVNPRNKNDFDDFDDDSSKLSENDAYVIQFVFGFFLFFFIINFFRCCIKIFSIDFSRN